MSISIEARISQGLARVVLADAKAQRDVVPNAAVRAARGARRSLVTQIKSRFGRKAHRGGKAFAQTLPNVPQKLTDMGNGRFGARVRTKAWFNHRRSRSFDLFWLFDNAPTILISGKGRLLAIPLPSAKLPSVGRGSTRKFPWPRDLISKGWKTTIIPKGRGVKNPIIMGGSPGTRRKNFKPLYVLLPNVTIRKSLDVRGTAKRFGDRIPQYIAAEFKKFGKRVGASRSIKIAA